MNKSGITLKRLLSALVAALLIFGLVPAGRIASSVRSASAESASNPVVNGHYVDGQWVEGGNGSITYNIDGTDVTLSKTAEPVPGQENTYKVTLKVETSTSTSQVVSSEQGAVVLVIDCSNSMDYCAECGGYNSHKGNCSHHGPVTEEQTRMYAAKNAAKNFIATYAGADASDSRLLAIVAFNSQYATKLEWTNVAGGAGNSGYDAAVKVINQLSTSAYYQNGGTNLEGGLYQAYQLLGDAKLNSVTAKNVILLTDGAPTLCMTEGDGTYGSPTFNAKAKDRADQIKNLGSVLYAVCFGAADDHTYTNGPTVGEFLKNDIASPDCYYNADNAGELTVAFEQIVEDITTGLSGEGWFVTDPMGYAIDFANGPAYFTNEGGETYKWELAEAQTSENGNVTTYIYTCSYTVTLDPQTPGFIEGKYYPTNGPTYLNIGDKTYAFPVPGVAGCLPRTCLTACKVWNDNNDQDGLRPSSVKLQLMKNGEPYGDPVTVSASNNWCYTWTDLVAMANGQNVVYTVTETNVPEGYTVSYSTQYGKVIVTNTHVVEKVSLTVKKVWNDNNDQDGIRPSQITVALMNGATQVATGKLTAANGWQYTFENLDKYSNGQLINYTVKETEVPAGYTPSVDGLVITNTHVVSKTEVSVSKVWNDGDNQDGIRPESITVELIANGHHTGKTLLLSAANNWAGTFTELDKFNNGVEVSYTVSENAVTGYQTTITGSQAAGYVITNSHTPCLIEICGQKEWFDNDNQDGVRPESITVHLLANGVEVATKVVTAADGWAWCFTGMPKYASNGAPIMYTFSEDPVEGYMTTYCCGVIKNVHCPEKTSITVNKIWDDLNDVDGIRPAYVTVHLYANGVDTGKTVVLTGANWWTATFSNLEKYQNGQLIEYTVVEDPVPGYEAVIVPMRCDGFTITNVHVPETTEVSGHKVWMDNDNQDGVRPDSITVVLYANGKEVSSMTVTAEDNWEWTFTDLPKYENGKLINYAVFEDAVENYYPVYECGGVIKNIHCPEKTSITVTKLWDDNNDQDGIRPGSVTVHLYADGVDTGLTLVLTYANWWTGTFYNLDKYANGHLIEYTVVEEPVPGYEAFIVPMRCEGFTITNVHVPEVVEIAGSKTWMDNDNQDGVRPESITINLLANGEIIDTITVTAEDGWAWSFTDLPKYENHGTLINYSITEELVEGYTTSYNNYNVVNTHAPEKTSVTVTKAWDDAGNQDGIRPYTVIIHLLANGEDTGLTLTLGSGNNWTGSFTDLDKYANGQLIEYTVSEEPVEGYETVITGGMVEGYIVTNVHTPELIEIAGVKTWNDNNDQDGARPEAITVNLLANGQVIDTVTVTAEDGWAWNFTNLPKYEAEGILIVYTVTENAIEDYSAEIDGYNITNTHTPAKTSVTVVKAWQDALDQDGIRPESVIVELVADGVPTGITVELSDENNWTATFTELDKYAAGVEIVYTVAEVNVEGYVSVITGSMETGFVITNTHTPEVIEIAGAKTWNDNNNQDGVRPESITISLLADGDVVSVVEVTAEDGWAWSFTELPKYRDGGVEIVYSIVETAVEGYSTEYDGYNVINSYTPEEISITVTKAWEGDNTKPKNTGHRVPVTIRLYADGELQEQTLVLSEENNWTGSFTGLPKYKDGQLIEYTIDELMEGALAEYYTVIVNGNVEEGFVVTNTHVPVTGDERTVPTSMVNVMIISCIVAMAGLTVLVCSLMGFVPFSCKRKNER